MRSAPTLSKIEDLNTFILFYKNQSEFEAITEYDDLDVSLQVGFSWRAWRPLKQRLPAAPRQCRAAEHSPNATTQTRNERPGRTGSGHEITSGQIEAGCREPDTQKVGRSYPCRPDHHVIQPTVGVPRGLRKHRFHLRSECTSRPALTCRRS